jgi:hypothetical protein
VAVERLELADTIVLKEWPHPAVYRWPSYSPHLDVIERFCEIWRRRVTYHRLVTALASLTRTLRITPLL